MIELRFEERIVHTGRTGTAKILQFRTKDVHIDSPTTTPVEPVWAEWKDVPVVQADT